MLGLIIAIFFGWAGGYQFYQKKKNWGILYLCTLGLLGIGWLIDILNAYKSFKGTQHAKQRNTPIQTSKFQNNAILYIHESKATEKNLKQINARRFIVFDTETTGVNPNTDSIISIAAIIFENRKPIDHFYTLVNPHRDIPSAATKVNGITNDMVSTAPSEKEACLDFQRFIGDALQGKTMLVAYNSIFDAKLLKHMMERYNIGGNIRHFDVLGFARDKIDGLDNYKQVTVAEHFGIDTANAHNSLRDCEICAEILLKLV